MARALSYALGMLAVAGLYKMGGWWGVGCLFAFGLGWHLCWRKLTGRWMDPVD